MINTLYVKRFMVGASSVLWLGLVGCNDPFSTRTAPPDSVAAQVQAPYVPSRLPDANTDNGNIADQGGNDDNDDGHIDFRTPAKLEVFPTEYDFQVQSLGSLNYATFTVTNTGEKVATAIHATGLTAPYSFREGPYPGLHGTCGNSLEPGQSCKMVITFQPMALQRYRLDTFTLWYDSNEPGQSVVLPLDGTATDIATLRFWNVTDDNDSFDFGTLAYGNSVTKTIRVRYWGARPASGVSFSGLTTPFSMVSNGCGDIVTADCDLVVRYDAANPGSQQQKLKVTYDNSSYAAEDNHTFLGATSPQVIPATLSIAGQGGNDFSRRLIGSTTDRTFNVTKGGTLPATNVTASAFSSSAFRFKGGSYPGQGGSCGSTITANCTIVLTFAPTANQDYSDTVSLSFNDGQTGRVASAGLAGRGAGKAVLTLAPASDPVDFGAHPVGLATDLKFTLTNDANGVTASSISITGILSPFVNIGGCSSGSLAPGASCDFYVRFRPTESGSATSPLNVSYYDGTETRNDLHRTLTGTGTAGALLGADIPTYDFGTVFIGDTKSAALTFHFYGAVSATVKGTTGINDPFSFTGGSFPGTDGSCGNSIDHDCTVSVSFTPTAVQAYSTTFVIQYDDGSGATQTVSMILKGTGAQRVPASLSFGQGASYNFGSVSVGQSKTVTLTVNRTGDYAASSIVASGLGGDFDFDGGSYPGTGGTCASSLSGSSCTIVVRFHPSVSAAEGPVSLTLSYNDGTGATKQVSIALSGRGSDLAVLMASPGNFPSIPVGQQEDLSVTVTNQGTRAANSIAVASSPTSPFSLGSNDCPSQLAVGSSCTISFHFAPTKPGSFTQSVSLGYDNGAGATSLSISLSAKGTVPVFLSVNGNFSCARVPTGELRCWGQNNYGQLGLGDSVSRLSPTSSAAISLGTGRYAVQVATGHFHACAVLDDSSVKCWGMNLYGELGLGTTSASVGASSGQMGDHLAAVDLGSGVTVRQLALGYAHSCALLSDGGVKCWGDNSEGQLGYGDTNERGAAVQDMGDNLAEVDLGGAKATQIAANTSHTCALLENGQVKCWGNNFFGQLGLGDFQNRGNQPNQMGGNLAAVDLGTGRTAKAITTGGAFTCALLDDSSVKCWGRNESGILGRLYCQDADGSVGLCSDPNYPLALRGYGIGQGQMGDALPAVDLGAGRKVLSVHAANSSTCAQLDDGSVKCWGQNNYGQLGLGDTTSRGVADGDMGNALPAMSLGTTPAMASFSTGNFHACAVFNTDQVKCWGYNRYGGLGLGDTVNRGDAAGQMGNALPWLSF